MSVSLWQAILLGALQGLTEFLPVSSSAHLAVVQHLLPGFQQPGILFDVMLHVGTLVAVVVFYRARLWQVVEGLGSKDPERRRLAGRLVGLLALSVAVTGAIAYPLRKMALSGLSDFRAMGIALCATSLLLLVAQRVGTRRGEGGRSFEEIRFADAALIGACQALSALFRGLSRSGNTISVGLFAGLSRRAAAEYSFILSVPTILAAAAAENVHEYRHSGALLPSGSTLLAYGAGMLTAGLVGYLAVAGLLRLVVSMRLQAFVVYTAALGIALALLGGR